MPRLKRPKVEIDPEEPEVKALMAEFDERFFHIMNYGGHTRIGSMESRYYTNPDGVLKERKDSYLATRELYHFENAYTGETVIVGYRNSKQGRVPIRVNKAEVWLYLPHRKYSQVVFLPGGPPEIKTFHVQTDNKDHEDEVPGFNLWRGFAYEPKKGDCSLYLNHVRDNICRGNEDHYKLVVAWMADAVQHPGRHGNWAVTVSGRKGTGKNVFSEAFCDLFGDHGIVLSGEKSVVSNFNAHLRNKVVAIADEAFFARDPRQDRVLKGMITGEWLRIEPKGVDSFQVPNYLHLIIIGNDSALVHATMDERRYFALECGEDHRQDKEYFGAIADQLRCGGYEALLFHLMYEVEAKIPRDAPQTDILKRQMALDPVEMMWVELLDRGWLPTIRPVNTSRTNQSDGGAAYVQIKDIVEWAHKSRRRGFSDITHQNVTWLFGPKCLGLGKPGPVRISGETVWGWKIPNLRASRQQWDARTQYKRDWDGDGDWEFDARLSGICPGCHKLECECSEETV